MPEPLRVATTLEQCWHTVPGGSAVSALAVVRRLADRDDVEVVGVAGRHRRPPRAEFAPPVAMRWLPVSRPLLYEAWNRVGWPRVEAVTGPVDVVHSTVAIPAATALAHVVTVHDAAFVHAPDRFTAHGARVMRAGLERCRSVDLVLVPSHRTADDLTELGFDPGRIRIVPWGVDRDRTTPHDVARVRHRYALPDRFVLFVGTVEPRKNLARLAAAVGRLDEPLPLVVAGARGWGDAAPVGGDTRFLGFVPADDLGALYAAAAVVGYPSLEEGFGMQVLEAMAHSTPVVTSADTATAEVAGDAAVLVDATDVDAIAAGLAEALGDSAGLIERGRTRAGEMTWEHAADLTVAAYREVAR